MSFLENGQYGEGFWKGHKLSDLETSHLINVVGMLETKADQSDTAGETENLCAFLAKRDEVQAEIDSRRSEVISRHEFRITEADILALAKSKGVKIPKSGAGVYIGKTRIQEVFVRFDTTTKLKETK